MVLGKPVHVRRWGSGTPIVALHGNPDSADSWAEVGAELPGGYQLVAPDLPGFGRSEANPAVYGSLSAMGNWCAALLEQLRLGPRPALMVHDLGAWFGFPALTGRPEQFGQVIVCAAPFGTNYDWHLYARLWRTPGIGEMAMRLMNRKLFLRVLKYRAPGLAPAFAERMYQRYKRPARQAALRIYRLLDEHTFSAWQEPVNRALSDREVLTLWGQDDRFVPLATARCFERSSHATIERAGHWPHLDQPAAVAGELARFLKGPGRRYR